LNKFFSFIRILKETGLILLHKGHILAGAVIYSHGNLIIKVILSGRIRW
jgi:hypothetical protein